MQDNSSYFSLDGEATSPTCGQFLNLRRSCRDDVRFDAAGATADDLGRFGPIALSHFVPRLRRRFCRSIQPFTPYAFKADIWLSRADH